MMRLDIDDPILTKAMAAFFISGACTFTVVFLTYVLWYLGKVD